MTSSGQAGGRDVAGRRRCFQLGQDALRRGAVAAPAGTPARACRGSGCCHARSPRRGAGRRSPAHGRRAPSPARRGCAAPPRSPVPVRGSSRCAGAASALYPAAPRKPPASALISGDSGSSASAWRACGTLLGATDVDQQVGEREMRFGRLGLSAIARRSEASARGQSQSYQNPMKPLEVMRLGRIRIDRQRGATAALASGNTSRGSRSAVMTSARYAIAVPAYARAQVGSRSIASRNAASATAGARRRAGRSRTSRAGRRDTPRRPRHRKDFANAPAPPPAPAPARKSPRRRSGPAG